MKFTCNTTTNAATATTPPTASVPNHEDANRFFLLLNAWRAGSLKRRFKSCPNFQSGMFSGGIVTTAPAVGSVAVAGPGEGSILGTGGVSRAGRMLVPLAPMTSQPDQVNVGVCPRADVIEAQLSWERGCGWGRLSCMGRRGGVRCTQVVHTRCT